MKKLIIFCALFVLSFSAWSQENFSGNWTLVTPSSIFELSLEQNGNTVSGNHCSTMYNGDFIDCEVPGKFAIVNGVSINGTVSSNSATVTFFSTYANDYGQAVIKKISENQISWKITVPPSDTYFIPDEAILTKE